MAVTPNYSWPVPVDTDYVKDGAEAIKDLGDAIDATVFGLPAPASGLTLISATTIGTAVSSVTVSSAFSATYDAYKIVVTGGVTAGYSELSLQLGSSTANYGSNLITCAFGSTSVNGASSNNTFTTFRLAGISDAAVNGGISFDLILRNPFLATTTHMNGAINTYNTSGISSGIHLVQASYTAFTIAATSSTMTGGTIRVYGYQN